MNEPIYERMQQLIRQIRQADTAYYKHDAPIMSDLEYDRLIDDLVALEEDSGVILSNSPTQHVAGETLETLAEVRHTKPMLSAAKTKSVDDLIRFAAGQDVLLSWKMDGLTLVLRYENGHLSQAITYRLSMSCPCCGAALEVGETAGGTHQLFCWNRSCTAKLVQKFVHFCDKSRMNIEGLSETTLEKLIGHGWIHTFADLYDLEQHRDAIIQTDGFGEKSFERLQAAIEKSRSCTLAKFIAGLGIPTVGRHAGRALDRCFGGSWEAFEAAIQKGFDFTQLPDFGAVMQKNLYTWYADAEEAKLWHPLLGKIHFIKETTPMSITKESPLYGKIVVATGKLEHYTRDGIQNKLLQIGAIPASSVTKKTNYLIVGEKAGSKLTKAQQLGVPTLTEEEFEALLAG